MAEFISAYVCYEDSGYEYGDTVKVNSVAVTRSEPGQVVVVFSDGKKWRSRLTMKQETAGILGGLLRLSETAAAKSVKGDLP